MMRALPFVRPRADQDAAHLVLALARLLGSGEDDVPTARARTVAADFTQYFSAVGRVSGCLPAQNLDRDIRACRFVVNRRLTTVGGCMPAVTQGMAGFNADFEAVYTRHKALTNCLKTSVMAMMAAYRCAAPQIMPSAAYLHCARGEMSAVAAYRVCHRNHTTAPHAAGLCQRHDNPPAQGRDHCRFTPYPAARAVPCAYYPVPLPPPVPPVIVRPCGARPPAHRLPLSFARRRVLQDAASLPLPFACFGRTPVPLKRSYIVTHTITAVLDGTTPLDLLSASFSADTGGFCWQGHITLYPDDFAKIDMDNRAAGKEAVIDVTLDGHRFRFIAEDYADSREFAKKTYTVSGRSITAKLSADYAQTHHGMVDNPLYARQLADGQLAMLDPYKITVWQIDDWLVPANSYAITDKTPLDVVMDITHAAGGFVESHISEPWLMIKPRWKVPAWRLDAAAPDAVIPESVIIAISGQKRISTRCNGVFVMVDHDGGKGADVYRDGSDREPRASVLSHPLYTDLPVHRAAGLAALSDTGRHKIETVKLPLADEYGLPPLRLGQIIQINEVSGYWRGVVTAVTLDVEVRDNAPGITQSVTLDRYMDA